MRFILLRVNATFKCRRKHFYGHSMDPHGLVPLQVSMAKTPWTTIRKPLYYRPQRSCGKVIFSQACVKNSVHGGIHTLPCEQNDRCLWKHNLAATMLRTVMRLWVLRDFRTYCAMDSSPSQSEQCIIQCAPQQSWIAIFWNRSVTTQALSLFFSWFGWITMNIFAFWAHKLAMFDFI